MGDVPLDRAEGVFGDILARSTLVGVSVGVHLIQTDLLTNHRQKIHLLGVSHFGLRGGGDSGTVSFVVHCVNRISGYYLGSSLNYDFCYESQTPTRYR